MALNYTDQELQDAVARLVRTSIRRQYGALGNRQTNLTFSDIQDAAVGVFVLQQDAPYYVVRLGADVLGELTGSTAATLEKLLDTVRAVDRRVKPVEQLSALANAKGALAALGSATSARSTSLTRITDVPAFKRFDQATGRFLRDAGSNVRSDGSIVQTPQEAREKLAGLVSSLKDEHTELLRRAGLLSSAITDYDQLNLPAKFSNSVVQNAHAVLEGHYATLDALSPLERLAVLRGVVLDVLATRAVVRGFGALEPTSTFVHFTGVGGPYADVAHPAQPASLLSDFGEPYVVLDATTLTLEVDGGTSISVDLPTSYVATVEGFIVEPYALGTAGPGQENNRLFIDVTGHSTLTVVLSSGTAQNAQDVADDINAVVGSRPITAEPYGPQLYLRSEPLVLSGASGNAVDFTRYNGEGWPAVATGLDPRVGDAVYVASTTANQGWYNITSISGLPAAFRATKQVGSPSNDSSGEPLGDLNRGGRALRIRFLAVHQQAAVTHRESLGIPVRETPKGEPNPVVERTQNTLGLPYNTSYQCEGTRAVDVVRFINDNPSIAPTGKARLEASTELGTLLWNGALRSDPYDSTKVVLSKLEGLTGTVTQVSFSGSVGTITLGNLSADPTAAGVHAGDQLVVRSLLSSTPTNKTDQVGRFGTLSSVTATQVVVPITYGTTGVDVGDRWTVECGPNLSAEPVPLTLVVAVGQVNQGLYPVGFLGGVTGTGPSFELGLERPLIQYTELGYQPHRFSGKVGRLHVRLTTQSVLLDSELSVLATSPAGPLLFSSLPAHAIGETDWFGIPEAPAQVVAGDYLELHNDPVQTPTYSLEIERVGSNPNVLQLVTTLPVDFGPWTMAQDSAAPYGRVRKRKRDNYDLLKASLDTWQAQPVNELKRYYSELRRLLNPLIINENPKASDVNAAVLHLQQLGVQLAALELHLSMYEARTVEEVNVLLESYLQQGANRAVALLVEASFSTFFGLDQDEASYIGDMQKAIRAVNVRDLPQRKVGRNPGGEVIEQYEETDYEFNLSDVTEEEIPVPGYVSESTDSAY